MDSIVRITTFLTRQRLMGLVMLVVLIGIRLWDPFPVKLLRHQTFDFYQRIQPRVAPSTQVVIVDIDEASLAQYGQWPWSRKVVADLVGRLVDLGASAIAFDMVFAERDRLSPRNIAESLSAVNQTTRDLLERLPDNDAILAEAFRQTNVVVSQSLLPQAKPENPDFPPISPAIREHGKDPRPFLPYNTGLLRTIPELEAAASGHGVITLGPEADGVVRRVPAILRLGSYILPALSLELFRVATGASTLEVYSDSSGVQKVSISQVFIPTDLNGRIWVYYSRQNSRTVPFG